MTTDDVIVPLAKIDGVTVGCGARDPANPDRTLGGPDVFDNDGLTSDTRMRSATMRAIGSADPPAANGTITVMGRDG